MTVKDRAARDVAIRGAMAQLVHDQRFTEFINVIRSQRDAAVEDLCLEKTMGNDRLTLGAIGEVRAYSSIIAVYDDFLSVALDTPNHTD